MQDSTSAAVAALIAGSQIRAALDDYALGIDARDREQWLSAFHPDARYEVGFPEASVQGHDALLAWVQEPWRFQTLTHLTANHRIQLHGDSHATGIGKALGLFKLEDGAVMLSTARYDDEYSRREGRWRISARRVSIISAFRLDDARDLILNGVPQPTAG